MNKAVRVTDNFLSEMQLHEVWVFIADKKNITIISHCININSIL